MTLAEITMPKCGPRVGEELLKKIRSLKGRDLVVVVRVIEGEDIRHRAEIWEICWCPGGQDGCEGYVGKLAVVEDDGRLMSLAHG